MTPKQLREKRAQVWAQMNDITAHAEGRNLTAEEISRWEALEGELTDLTHELEVAERAAKLGKSFDSTEATSPIDNTRVDELDQPAPEKAYESAWGRFMRSGMVSLSADDRAAMAGGQMSASELRALGATVPSAGGYFVPTGFRARIVEKLKAFGAVRNVAEVITTDTGNPLPWPTNDDTANVGAILAENTQVTEQDVVLGTDTLGAYTYTSKLVRVAIQLLQDSAFDLESFLSRKFAERLGRATNAHFTTGTGSSQPEGVVTGSTLGKLGANGQTLTVTYNDLVDLVYSVDAAYRTAGGSRVAFMAHDASLGIVRKLRDDSGGAGIGRPLWEPSIQIGQPDSLLGYPIIANNDMPVMAASAKSILFGDFEAAFVIREVLGIQSLRLEERYADFLQVGFLAFLRTDSQTQDSGAVKHYQNSAT